MLSYFCFDLGFRYKYVFAQKKCVNNLKTLIYFKKRSISLHKVTYPLVVTHITIVLIILATFTISTVVSFAFAVVFELPIIACDRIILGWAAQKMGGLFGRGENKSKGKERTLK